jgi:uncharacterized damage-inducible protein DinB
MIEGGEQVMTTRPDSTEYAPYYGKYVSLVPDGDIIANLEAQFNTTRKVLAAIPEERAGYAYEPGKWTIKQLVGHLVDSERVFAYRALRFGRNDPTPLPGFEQDDYVAQANFNARKLVSLVEEFAAVRQANLQLFKSFGHEEWLRRGTASGMGVSARALAYIIAGHELHHLGILKARYL